ncbi:lysophospholipase [Litorimonas sp. WD9-15]|uniref:alpha/beta hydrolase n=1 Tax=Litorimonas sp. WD9-15 TaxID=3418716 RepID=UPI003D041D4B
MSLSFTTSDGLALYGYHWPVDNPKAMMTLVHGFGEHAGRYADMAAHLNAQGIAVVAVDFRGHGQSPGPRGVIRDYNDFRMDLSALLEGSRMLYPKCTRVLFGHSMGGGIVLDHGLSEACDVCAVIASAPLIALAKPVPAPLRIVSKLMAKLTPKGVMSQPIDGSKISTLKSEQDIYVQDPLNHGKLGFRLAVEMVETGEAVAAKAEQWDAPLLLFHSRDDALTGFAASEDFAARAKHTVFHAMEGVAHEMHNDTTRQQVYGLISDFILTQAKRPRA